MPGLQGYQAGTIGAQQGNDANRAAMAPLQATNATLMSKLKQMEDTMWQNRANTRKAQAGQDAIIDVAKYKKEIGKIEDEYADEPQYVRDAKKKEVQAGRFKDAATIYGSAYKDKWSSAYSDEVTQDVLEKSTMAEIASQGNAEMFATAMNTYGVEMTKNAPTPELAQFTRLSYEKAGVTGFKKMMLANKGVDKAVRKKGSEEVIDYFEQEYITAFRNADDASIVDSTAKLQASLQAAVNNGFMTPNQMTVRMLTAGQDAVVAKYNTQITSAIDTGQEDIGGMIDKIVTSEDFSKLPEKKKNDLRTSLFADLKADDSERRQKQTDKDKFDEKAKDDNYYSTLGEIYSKNIKLGDINKLEESGQLKKADADSLRQTLSQGSRQYSDDQAIARYSIASRLVNATEKEIFTDPLLAWDDVTKLLDKRTKMVQKEYKWTTSVNGKDGIDRIKRHFGLAEGKLIIDLDKETEAAYNAAMINLYDHIGTLPDSEKSSAAVPYAMDIINGYDDKLKTEEAEYVKQRDTKREKEASEAWTKYQTGWTSMFNSLTDSDYSESEFRKKFYKSKHYSTPEGGF